MAILSKIRSKSWLLIVFVGLALFMFIASPEDIMSFFNSEKANSIGNVNGEYITRDEFTERVKEFSASNQNTNSSQTAMQVWENLVGEKIFNDQLKKAGITVGEQEIWKAIINNPDIKNNPQFQNEAGLFDEESLKTYILEMKEDKSPEGKNRYKGWLTYTKNVEKNIAQNSYLSAVSAGLGTPLETAKKEYIKTNTKVSGKFVLLPFSSIPDSTITVTNKEIEAYVEAHKNQFKTKATRNVQFAVFKTEASAQDKQEIKAAILKLIDNFVEYNNISKSNDTIKGFRNTENIANFVNDHSDIPYNNNFIFKTANPSPTDSLFTKPIGMVWGPYEEDGHYKISKVVEQKQVPSVRASHILIAYKGAMRAKPDIARTKEEAKQKAEEILVKIKGGANFTIEAMTNSDDSSAQNGGDLNWFKEGEMVPTFNDWVFSHNKGDIGLVESDFGYHVIKKTDAKSELGIKVATLAKIIEPSNITVNKGFEVAESFNSKVSNKPKDFEKIAKEAKVEVLKAENLSRNDEYINGLPGVNAGIVGWAFDNQTKVGDIKRFDLEKSYVVVQVTDKQKEGIMNAKSASNKVKPILIDQKKAALLMKKMEKGTLEAVAQAEKVSVQDFTESTLNEPAPNFVGDKAAIGAALTMKEGTIVRGVVGRIGVYALQLNTRTSPAALNSYEPFRLQMQKMLRKDPNTIYMGLRDASNVGELNLQ